MSTSQSLAYPYPKVHIKAGARSSWTTSASMLLVDLLALSSVYWLVVIGRYFFYPNYDLHFYVDLYPVIAIFLGAFYINNLYPGMLLHPAEELRRVFKCVSIVLLLVALGVFFARTGDFYSRSIFLMIWVAGAPAVLLARCVSRHFLSKQGWWGVPAVVLGHGLCAQRITQSLGSNVGLRIAGVLADDPSFCPSEDFPPLLGTLSAAPNLAKRRIAEYALVAMPDKTNAELRYIIQNFCRGFRHVLLVPDLPGICSLGIAAHEIGGEVCLELPQRLCHTSAKVTKRLFDIIAGTCFLLLASPLFLLIAIAIKATSRGPLFFGHSRYGQDGMQFKAWKFRTMAQNADELLAAYLASDPKLRIEWERDHKLRTDPRVTSIGKWLRRLSLDELPQLFNVLIGQMSLVGPRPIVKSEINKYGDGYDLYTRVPPGITGLWQVSGRNDTTYAQRVAFDEYYVRNWSVWLDAYILTKTVRVVLTSHGAY